MVTGLGVYAVILIGCCQVTGLTNRQEIAYLLFSVIKVMFEDGVKENP